MAEEERPYHIQAIYDLKADYSSEHFRLAMGECRKVIAELIADDNSSDQQIARVHILRYLDLQLSRAVRWAEDEADLMAVAGLVRQNRFTPSGRPVEAMAHAGTPAEGAASHRGHLLHPAQLSQPGADRTATEGDPPGDPRRS